MSAQTLLGAYGTEGEPSRFPLDLELAAANLRSRGVNGLLAALLRLNFMYIKRMCCLELHSHLGISANCLFTPHRPFLGLLASSIVASLSAASFLRGTKQDSDTQRIEKARSLYFCLFINR